MNCVDCGMIIIKGLRCFSCGRKHQQEYRKNYYRDRYRKDPEFHGRMLSYIRRYDSAHRQIHFCLTCGKQINRGCYCSSCRINHKAPSQIKQRQKERFYEKYGPNGVKRYEMAQGICEEKGCKNKATQIHHVNWNPEDNRLENLKCLCDSSARRLHSFVRHEYPKRFPEEITRLSEEWLTELHV